MARPKKRTSTKTTKKVQAMDNMKYEIANEFGVNLGADASSRANGSVGGEMTKRLVQNGKGKSTSKKNSRSK